MQQENDILSNKYCVCESLYIAFYLADIINAVTVLSNNQTVINIYCGGKYNDNFSQHLIVFYSKIIDLAVGGRNFTH